MNIITDFHTHTFPDSVAPGAIANLSKMGKIRPYSDGTLAGLKASMAKNGITYSVILRVDQPHRRLAQRQGRNNIRWSYPPRLRKCR